MGEGVTDGGRAEAVGAAAAAVVPGVDPAPGAAGWQAAMAKDRSATVRFDLAGILGLPPFRVPTSSIRCDAARLPAFQFVAI